MNYGKSIRVYLADGVATGIKHAEIVNWTGQAISCPRKRINELREWPESKSPGVYFLLGEEIERDVPLVYIGESENVSERISIHGVKKEFWRDVVFFTNKDENLTKAHIRYLESRLVQQAIQVDRSVIENGNSPQPPTIPRSDRDAMEEFLGNIRVLMGVLGHRFLEPIYTDNSGAETESAIPSVSNDIPLALNYRKLKASALLTDEGVVVLKGAEALSQIKETLTPGYKKIKQDLIDSGKLIKSGDKLILQVDYLFKSPSAAAGILIGQASNGRVLWKDDLGRTIAQIEEEV
jgi:hypothetical protein